METGSSDTWDVIVIGAGGCGLMAALAAADSGARVLVLEKTDAPGGGTALSSRGIRAAGSSLQKAAGIQDDPSLWAADILARNGGTSDPEQVRTLTEVSGSMVDFVDRVTDLEFELGRFVFGHNVQRSHSWGDHQTITDYLYRAAAKDDRIRFRFETPVLDLWCGEDGSVQGVVTHAGRLAARVTILAPGGFGANPTMVATHIPIAAGIPTPSHKGSTGEGIEMAVRAGAVLADMDSFQPYPAYVHPSGKLVSPEVIFSGGIMVDGSGHRFVNEMRYPGKLSTAMLGLPGKSAYEILDQGIFEQHSSTHLGALDDLVVDGVVAHADDARTLATALGIDPDGLERTLAAYAAVPEGGTDEFGRTVTVRLQPPYYGVRVHVALFQTQGGIRIDTRGQVIRADGSPIPGLLAGGGVARGISGPGSEGYMPGNGLIASLGMGYIIGREAAAAAR
ncbi:MAG: FAD-dependent oxidoreductase [Chloroflexi bacterium]|nr:FAD-dependent oxidoreductase [Chloroflexota bacterium]